jgi:hypothetical protein
MVVYMIEKISQNADLHFLFVEFDQAIILD